MFITTYLNGVHYYSNYTSVQQALKQQIITVFERMYLDVLYDEMVGFANITAQEILDHRFMSYGNITGVDLENNFEKNHRAWDPQKPVESMFKQIQDCADYSEAGGVLTGHPQQSNVGYAKIFATGHFMSSCRRWNEHPTWKKLGHNSKLTLPWHIAITSKFRVNLQPHQVTIQQTPL
jgi:hypothetical protein